MIENFIPSPSVFIVHLYVLFLLLANVVDIGIFSSGAIKPAFFLIGLYGVLLLRPHYMPQVAVFLYGVLFDLLMGTPVGLTPIMGLVLLFIIESSRRYLQGQSWPVIWSGFILGYAILIVIESFLYGLFSDVPTDMVMIAGKLFVSITSFPLLFMPFLWIERWIKRKEV